MVNQTTLSFMQIVGSAAGVTKRLSPASATASSSTAFSGAPSAQNGRHLSVVAAAAVAADGNDVSDFRVLRALLDGGSAT